MRHYLRPILFAAFHFLHFSANQTAGPLALARLRFLLRLARGSGRPVAAGFLRRPGYGASRRRRRRRH
jgi:hypothetical protein